METGESANALDNTKRLESVATSISCLVEELRKNDTGQISRAEYIRTLDQLASDDRHCIRFSVPEPEDLGFIEATGYSFSQLRLVAVNNDTYTRRGELVLEGPSGQAIELSVLDLPSGYAPLIAVTHPNGR